MPARISAEEYGGGENRETREKNTDAKKYKMRIDHEKRCKCSRNREIRETREKNADAKKCEGKSATNGKYPNISRIAFLLQSF